MANDGDGNGHSPHKCACCDEDIGEDDNVLTCELCSFRFIKTTCVGMSAKIACGSIQWKCPECSKINTANLLQQIMSKLSKIDEIGKDVEILKSQNRNERRGYTHVASLNRMDSKGNGASLNRLDSKENSAYLHESVATHDDNAELPESQNCTQVVSKQLYESYADRTKGKTVVAMAGSHGSLNPFFRRNQRRDSISSQVSGSREKRRRVSPVKVPVVTGTATASTVKGVKSAEREVRRHYFLSRVTTDVDIDVLKEYCKEKNLTVLGCRELPSKRKDMKSFHIVVPAAECLIAEDSDTWPEDIILRRYFLNEEARTWLKSMN